MLHAGHKRTHYLINKSFQLKYTISIIAILLVVMFASVAGIYMGMWGSIIENFSKFKVSQDLENVRRIAEYEGARFKFGDHRLERIFREAELLSEKDRLALEGALKAVNRSLIPKVLILSIVIFLGGIIVSHKIAGPIYRIEQSARAIRDGDLRVNFNVRKSDEMKETAHVLEEMVETLHHDVKKIKAEVSALEDRLRIIAKHISNEDANRIDAALKEINATLTKYKT